MFGEPVKTKCPSWDEFNALEKSDNPILKEIYLMWRRQDVVNASLAWAEFLLGEQRGSEASAIVNSARAEVAGREFERQKLENAWRHVLDEIQDGRV